MKHPTKKEWISYMTRRLSTDEYVHYETHLYTCDRCLSVYMRCIEEHADQFPLLQDEVALSEKVMVSVRRKQPPLRRRPFYQRTLFHYGAAAVITLVLMTGGMFQGLLSVVSDVESRAVTEQQISFSDHLMERAGNMLDSIDPTTRRDHHE